MKTLLAQNGLPTADLDAAQIDWLVAVDDRNDLKGLVGLERFGEAALLRSLAVVAEARRSGIGTLLVNDAEARALSTDVQCLVLLTQTAEAFFAARSYAPIDRSAAPEAVQRSAEFQSLCPASAVCMMRQLA